MKKNRLIRMLSLLLCAMMLLTACSAGGNNADTKDTPADTGSKADDNGSSNEGNDDTAGDDNGQTSGDQYGGVLKIGTGITIPVIGYTPEITNNAYNQFLRAAFNSLLNYNEDGSLTGELAESWETDPEAKTITFKLKSGVQFSDGTDFNAEAVKWNIEEYQSVGRTEVSAVKEIQCPDEQTVILELEEWVSSALESIGFFVYYMSPSAFEENGGADWARLNPVGTGPFVMTEWNQSSSVKYSRNDNYWEEGKPYLDGVEFSIIEEATTLSNALQAGEIDLISYASLDTVKELDALGTYTITKNQNGNGVESTGIIPSSADESSPFADALVRQAMCYAIDKETIVGTLGYGYLQTTNQWAAEGASTFNTEVEGYPYNPEKAKELLTEAGYADGFDTVIYTGTGTELWATAIADQLTNVGIRTQIEIIDGAKSSDQMANGWDGLIFHYASVSPDLGLYMGRHLDVNGAYYARGIQHPEDTLELLQNIRTAKDDESKTAYSLELQKLIYDEYALFGLPLYISAIYTIKQPYVQGDNWTGVHVAVWEPANAWLDK